MYHKDGKKRGATLIICIIILVGSQLAAGCVTPWPQKTPGQSPGTPIPAGTPHPAGGSLEVHFLDVGQGDAILVLYGNKSMLVDGGPLDAGAAVAAYLKGHG